MLVLDTFELDDVNLVVLTGEPPYPHFIPSLAVFWDIWPALSAAIHGRSARTYLQYCDELMTAVRQ